MNRTVKSLIIGFVIFVVGLLFWFNRYSFSETRIGENVFPVRTSRITGKSEICVMGNWTTLKPAEQTSETPRKTFLLANDDLRRLQGRTGLSLVMDGATHFVFQCSIYNGTSYTLQDVTVKVEVEPSDSESGISREYCMKLKKNEVLSSLANGNFEADIGMNLEKRKWTWGIVSATGLQ